MVPAASAAKQPTARADGHGRGPATTLHENEVDARTSRVQPRAAVTDVEADTGCGGILDPANRLVRAAANYHVVSSPAKGRTNGSISRHGGAVGSRLRKESCDGSHHRTMLRIGCA